MVFKREIERIEHRGRNEAALEKDKGQKSTVRAQLNEEQSLRCDDAIKIRIFLNI